MKILPTDNAPTTLDKLESGDVFDLDREIYLLSDNGGYEHRKVVNIRTGQLHDFALECRITRIYPNATVLLEGEQK